MTRIITLCTDFGLADGYVAAMKGVILALCPGAQLIDITHQVPPQDLAAGAHVMSVATGRFPRGTVHLGVVDPGVGSSRRGMVLCAGPHFFVGPDNGLFSFALENYDRAYEITPSPGASPTFHGRDLFAPAAARLAAGEKAENLGPPIESPVRLESWTKEFRDKVVVGRVTHIDHFGNVITNLRLGDFPGGTKGLAILNPLVPVGLPVGTTYSDVPEGESLWLVGSEGNYELATRNGNAAKKYGIRRGDKVSGERNSI